MQQDTISRAQLTAMIWGGILAPAAELLPAMILPISGRGAWLAPVAAIPVAFICAWLLGRLAGSEGLAASLRASLGSVAGSTVLILYMVWAEGLLALRLRLCAQRLLASGQRDGEMWFFLVVISGLVLWMGLGKLAAFARAGQLFLAILLATVAVVLGLSLFQVGPERVLPLWTRDAMPVLQSALPTAGVLCWGLWGAFLTGQIEQKRPKRRGGWLIGGGSGCLLLALSQWIILGNFGPALAQRLDNPFFALAKSVGVKGAFQRVESVIAALWTLSDLAMAALLLFAIRTIILTMLPQWKAGWAAAAGLIPAAGLAFFFGEPAQRWNQTLVPWGNLIFSLVIPLLLLAPVLICEKRQKEGTSCGGNGG